MLLEKDEKHRKFIAYAKRFARYKESAKRRQQNKDFGTNENLLPELRQDSVTILFTSFLSVCKKLLTATGKCNFRRVGAV